MVFKFFASSLSRKILFKFLLASIKTLTNSGYFTESCNRIPPPPPPHPPTRLAATQRELWASIQHLKMPTVNHPPVMKSNTIACFKFISSLRNSSQSQVPACRNKQFEEDYYLLKGFSQIISVFIEASQNFLFYFSRTRQQKNLKTVGAYTKCTIWVLRPSKTLRDTIP